MVCMKEGDRLDEWIAPVFFALWVPVTSMSSLEFGGLYLALYARDDREKPHWALYHRSSPSTDRGFKYHIRNMGEGWIADFSDLTASGISKEFLLIGFVKIASITNPESIQHLHDTITSHPYSDPDINCLVWLAGALKKCIALGFLVCPDLDKVLEEGFAFNNAHWDDASNAVMPRPVITSKNVSFTATYI